MNRKKSYERLMRLDQQLYNLYKHSGAGAIQKIENTQQRIANIYGANKAGLKPANYYMGGGGGGNGNYSFVAASAAGLGSELDIQGKSMISKHQINNSYM